MSRLETWLAWILLAVAISLLHLRIVLQSDILFYDDLLNDLIVHGGAWSNWKFSAAPGFFPDLALYAVGFFVFPDVPSRILFVSAMQAVALALLSIALVRRLTRHGLRRNDAQVVLAVAFATLVSAQSGMWLYFQTTNNHFGAVLFGLIGTMLALRLARQSSWPHALALLVVVGAAGMSSRLFVLTFTLPCLAVAAMALLLTRRTERSALRQQRTATLARLIAVLAGGQVLAMLLEHLLIHHIPVEARPPLSVESISASLTFLTRATVAAFDHDNAATLLLALLLSGCLLYLLYLLYLRLSRKIRHDHAATAPAPIRTDAVDSDIQAVGALLCVSLPLTIAGAVLSGAIVDNAGYRYLAFPLVLAVLLALVHANRRACRPWWAHGAWVAGAALVAGNAAWLAYQPPQPGAPSTAVAQCVAAAGAEGFPLQAGIADYWNARAVSYQLPDRNPIIATLRDVSPLFWVSTLGPLSNPDRYPGYHYNFAILRRPGGGDQFDYTPETIGRLLPRPARIRTCPDGVTQLWLYNDAELHTVVQAAITTFMQQRKNTP
jgi:hypothetical protein